MKTLLTIIALAAALPCFADLPPPIKIPPSCYDCMHKGYAHTRPASGIWIETLGNGTSLADQQWIAEYNSLAATYGAKITPAIKPGFGVVRLWAVGMEDMPRFPAGAYYSVTPAARAAYASMQALAKGGNP